MVAWYFALVTIRDRKLRINAEAWTDGDLGFVVDQPTVTLKDGRSVQMRATTILQKESGRWKIVHQHSSIGVPNEQVEAFQGFEEAVEKA
jgi:ketosteroid isomerase-like protein